MQEAVEVGLRCKRFNVGELSYHSSILNPESDYNKL